ncbi:MAG: GNAT family protein [Bacteroidota bacterium]
MTTTVRLRALTLADSSITWKWRNQEDVRNEFSGHPFPVSLEMEKEWYEKNIHANFPNTAFGVELIATGELIGMTFIKNINMINRNAEFAILIDSAHSGKGYGTHACKATLEFIFLKLGLHRVYLKVKKSNVAAIKLYETCGFKTEGTLREDVFKQGQFSDQLIMAILVGEFK